MESGYSFNLFVILKSGNGYNPTCDDNCLRNFLDDHVKYS